MIEIEEHFSTTVIVEDIIIPNSWNIKVKLIPNNNKNKLYNKAMERIQYYISEVIDNSIFVGAHNLSKVLQIPFQAQVHVFPDDPWDHLIAMCLYTKITAMCEEVFYVDSIVINSHQSRGISHNYDSEQDGNGANLLSLFDDEDLQEYVKYWYKPNPQLFLLHDGFKIVEQDWAEESLEFDSKQTGTVVTLKDFKKGRSTDDDDIT